MKTWVLAPGAPSASADGTGASVADEALASLETYRLEAAGPDGLRGSAYGVASVFTAEALRGNGYAVALCRLIQEKLRQLDPNTLAVVLYSDVGARIYERAGYVCPEALPVNHYLKRHTDAGADARSAAAVAGVEWLTRGSVGALADEAAKEMLRSAPSHAFRILPTSAQLGWALEREVVTCEQLGRAVLPFAGARAGDSYMVVWTADLAKQGYLKVLLFKAGDEANTAAMVAAAVSMAIQGTVYHGGVKLWGPGSVLGQWPISKQALAAAGVMYEEKPRVGSLPMLASAVHSPVALAMLRSAPSHAFRILPTSAQLGWALEREVVTCEQLGRAVLPFAGARAGDSYMVWTADLAKQGYLKVLLFRAGNEANTAAVVAAAVSMAIQGTVYDGGVKLWGPGSVLGQWPVSKQALAAAGVMYEEKLRVGSLPMLASIHPAVDPSAWRCIPQLLWL
eukprot:SM000148S01017  [mRNA]  locus=s148:133742:143178:+ [translate_table: standard]